MQDHHATDAADTASHGSLKSYSIGFILSILLTLLPYAMVTMEKPYAKWLILGVIIVCAIVQLLIQLVCFLHMDRSSGSGWNVSALLFTVLIIAIIVIGSLWIMYNLNEMMMPAMMSM